MQDSDFPFFVRIFVLEHDALSESVCGGFFLTPKLVMTAAHCIGPRTESIRIYHPTSNRQAYAVGYTVHPQYNRHLDGDVALVNLSHAILQHEEHLPVVQGLENWEGVEMIVIGYGIYEVGTMSDVLRAGHLIGMSQQNCRDQYWGSNVRDDQCAVGESGLVDSCNGDSGGPVVLRNNTKRIIGVVSRGSADCGSAAGIYTDLLRYYQGNAFTTSQTVLASSAMGSAWSAFALVMCLRLGTQS